MDLTAHAGWQPLLQDPSGVRRSKPRTAGLTMVIDKGIGLNGFEDLLQTAATHMDYIKLGFGTSPLYPLDLLRRKIEMAKLHELVVYPGGTFLEVAVHHGKVDEYFQMVAMLGFNGLEVSDGTIDLDRATRNELIERGRMMNWTVLTEYGKKAWGSKIEAERLLETIREDVEFGAELVIVEGRESGKGVGMYDEHGACREETLFEVIRRLHKPDMVMWEAPLKQQQVELVQKVGPQVNLGNIPAEDVLSLECLRRGLRSDTFVLK